jgi:hypothetical protein
VFVDVSQSIQGFTGLGSVALEALHAQVIEASLSALQLNNPFQRCRVDDAVRCEAPFVTAQQLRLRRRTAGPTRRCTWRCDGRRARPGPTCSSPTRSTPGP